MNVLRQPIYSLATIALIASLSTPALSGFFSSDEDTSLTLKKLQQISSANITAADIDSTKILMDNNEAFDSKIEIIKNAQESLKLVYFIYATDYSTSRLSRELIKAATERGVKVQILVDYITNYSKLDFFKMLEREGAKGNPKGSISVKFYGRPTRNILLDAMYLTTGCGEELMRKDDPTACAKKKLAIIDQEFKDVPELLRKNLATFTTQESSQLLTGLYSKDGALLIDAVLRGQKIDIEKLKAGSGETSKEDIEGLKKFLKLVKAAKIGPASERALAQIQLMMAFQMYGEQINPIYNLVTGLLPIETENSAAYYKSRFTHGKDWVHITDYTHHKLILADGKTFQMGGRNLEDSYHMNNNSLSEKYTFMDTDIKVNLKSSNKDLIQSYERLWNYSQLVADISEIEKVAPVDLLATRALALEECKKIHKTKKEIGVCVNEKSKKIVSQEIRMDRHLKQMFQNEQVYFNFTTSERVYGPYANAGMELSQKDLKTAKLFYLENLTFKKNDPEQTRIYGSRDDAEAEHGRYIHEAWVSGLESVCKSATKSNPQRVIFHNAYFAPSSNLLSAFSKMVDGTLSCGNVKVQFLTNSAETTDLRIVNGLGINLMQAFFNYYKDQQSSKECATQKKCASFEYYEYNKEGSADESNRSSLHSKVTVLGEKDIIVGSANADIRSYMMDTNNALMVRSAQDLVSHYVRTFDSILSTPGRVKDRTLELMNLSQEQVQAKVLYFLNRDIAKYGVDKRISEERLNKLRSYVLGILGQANIFAQFSVNNLKTEKAAAENERLFPDNSDFYQREYQELKDKKKKFKNKLDIYFQVI